MKVSGVIETKPIMRSVTKRTDGEDLRLVEFKLRLPKKDGVVKCISWWDEQNGIAPDIVGKGDKAKGQMVVIEGKFQSRPERKGKHTFTFQNIVIQRKVRWLDEE